MKSRWFITLIAIVPVAAGLLALQSCGGEGGPTSGSGGGLPSVSQQFLALLSADQAGSSYIGAEGCVAGTCHGGSGARADVSVYQHWKDTKHADKGVNCERCHGPGSKHAANPTSTNILNGPKLTSPVVCAQCHGPIYDQWNFSQHSKIIVDPVEDLITNPTTYGKSSRCGSCHSGLFRTELNEGGVDIANVNNSVIVEIGERTLDTVPHTANCVTCHNPHKNTGNLTDTGDEVQLRHKTFNDVTTPIGPGQPASSTTTFDHICAQCHNGRGANPADSALNSGTSRPNMHDSNQYNMLMGLGGVEAGGPVTPSNTAHASIPGQCSKCHMPNSTHSFTVSYDKSCSPCHTAADAAARVNTTKSDIVDKLFALRTRMEEYALAHYGNRDFWDYTSIITAEYGTGTGPNQSTVPIQLKRARHNYYFIIRDRGYGVHNAPYARHLLTIANINMQAIDAPAISASRSLTTSFNEKLKVIEQDLARARKAELEK